MSNLSRRPPLTPETALATPLRTLLDRVDDFTRRHPVVKVSPPYTNPSGKWEVSEPDKAAVAFDNGHVMIADLEARYPE